jgi:sugar lactone lactonase YvrE
MRDRPTDQPKVLLDGLVFPEGPRWHGDKLWFSDMHAHKILTVDLNGQAQVVAELHDKPSGLGFLPDDTPIAVSMRRRLILRLSPDGLETHADLNDVPGDYLNDMVVDNYGRAYVGNRIQRPMSHAALDLRNADSGPLEDIVLVHPDGSHEVTARGLVTPNGLAITQDGATLIVAETRRRQLSAFEIVQSSGALRNRRIYGSTGGGFPDGIALDASGAVWIGSPFTEDFLRIREGGDVADRIKLRDGEWAIACALGGYDRRILFLLTAVTTLENSAACIDYESDLRSTAKGAIATVEVDVPGVGWP